MITIDSGNDFDRNEQTADEFVRTLLLTLGDNAIEPGMAPPDYRRVIFGKTYNSKTALCLVVSAVVLHIGQWSLAEAVDRAVRHAAKNIPSFPTNDVAQMNKSLFEPLVSIILYLCSAQPEIDDARHPGQGPVRAAPRKTQSGWRTFPADRPVYFNVGAHTGLKLREARAESVREVAQTGRTVRPHIRRGHWHGFWCGPRDGARRFNLKWLSPLFVASAEAAPS